METETWIDREIRETTERVRVLREYFAETEEDEQHVGV